MRRHPITKLPKTAWSARRIERWEKHLQPPFLVRLCRSSIWVQAVWHTYLYKCIFHFLYHQSQNVVPMRDVLLSRLISAVCVGRVWYADACVCDVVCVCACACVRACVRACVVGARLNARENKDSCPLLLVFSYLSDCLMAWQLNEHKYLKNKLI